MTSFMLQRVRNRGNYADDSATPDCLQPA